MLASPLVTNQDAALAKDFDQDETPHVMLQPYPQTEAEDPHIWPLAVPGDIEAIEASDLFDPAWYRASQAPDLLPLDSPAAHYLQFGAERGLDPSPGFDANAYRLEHGGVPPGANVLLHHLRHPDAAGRRIRPVLDYEDILAIQSSPQFDAAWYSATQAAGLPDWVPPAWHYLHFGNERALNPGPSFDANAYRLEHGDVQAGANPLLFHVRHPAPECRRIRPVLDQTDILAVESSPLFDSVWYGATQAPGLPDWASPAWHYLHFGDEHALNPGPLFDASAYRLEHGDVPAGANPLLHHLRHPESGGRRLRAVLDPADVTAVADSDLFDAAWYRASQALGLPDGVSPAWHYLHFSAERGLDPGPGFDAHAYIFEHGDVPAGSPVLLHHLRAADAATRRVRPVQDYADIEAIAGSDIFNPAWYRATQAPGLPDWLQAAWHYLQFGAEAGLNPGPLFDSDFYLRESPYVAAFGTNPLLHYLRNGREEDRPVRNAGAVAPPDARGPVLEVNLPPEMPRIGPVAVVVHAFYPDLFAEIAEKLTNLPPGYILLIGVPDAQAKRVVAQAVAQAGLRPQRVLCRIVPNRGRNFATLLAAFSTEILHCKLLLHLHTKRSLYTGRERADWRRSLFDGLIGSASLISVVLDRFDCDPKLGLVYPAPPEDLPYWAYHWLSNAHLADPLFARLGVAGPPKGAYFDYPVGGMFWARVEALRPLLEAGFTHADFPAEAGQTDGTLAHALERAVGIVPRSLGYGFVEVDLQTGTFRDSWSTRNLAQYRATSLAGFEQCLDATDLISFDIFDTLITRPALAPDSVLRHVGHILALEVPALGDFFDRRKQAEAQARAVRNFAQDVTLDDIYAAFAAQGEEWTQARIDQALRLERDTDRHIMRARPGGPDMLRLARARGRRVIAISDTYYTQDDITALLCQSGYNPTDFDAMYLSSAHGARKDRGDLWAYVRDREAAVPARWLHVGDNEQSDIQAACDAGLKFFHVMNPAHLAEAEGFPRSDAPDTLRWSADLVIGPALLRIAGNPFLSGRSFGSMELANACDVGYTVFGPLIFTFLAWLIRHPALRHASHIYFLAREGYLLHRIYAEIRVRFPELGVPPATYFYASRRATLSAAQSAAFIPEHIVAGAGFRGSLQDLLQSRMGLELPESYAARDWLIQLPDDEEVVLAALNTLKDVLLENVQAEAESLVSYAHAAGMGQHGMSAVVDIGYSATIQRNLQAVLGVKLIGFYMGAHDLAQQVEETGGYAFGCFAEDIVPWTSNCPALQQSRLMEAFLTAPHGQLLHFRAGEPSFKAHSMTGPRVRLLQELHDGAAKYCQELWDLYGPALLLADIELLQPQQFLAMLANGHLRMPPELAGFFVLEDDYCGNGEIVIDL